MRIKIVSDGTSSGTKVIDEETGEALSCVQSVTWRAEAGETFARATINMVNVPVEIVGDGEVFHDEPPTGR